MQNDQNGVALLMVLFIDIDVDLHVVFVLNSLEGNTLNGLHCGHPPAECRGGEPADTFTFSVLFNLYSAGERKI